MKRLAWSRRIETNLLRNFALATPADYATGLHWYQTAYNTAVDIAAQYSLDVWKSAGVVAALSPGLEWGRNVLQAEELIRAWVAGNTLPIVGVYGRKNVEKARRMLAGEWPLEVMPATSPKTRAFFYNILWPEGDALVTVDRHAKAIAYNLASERAGSASKDAESAVKGEGEYAYLSWHYRTIAARFQLVPSQFQAILWTNWKRRGEERETEVPF